MARRPRSAARRAASSPAPPEPTTITSYVPLRTARSEIEFQAGFRPAGSDQLSAAREGDVGGTHILATEGDVGDELVRKRYMLDAPIERIHDRDAAGPDGSDAQPPRRSQRQTVEPHVPGH